MAADNTTIAVEVPHVGESISEGIIASWHVKNGDFVEEGSIIFELETDKATLDVPSPATGVITITVTEGADVTVGQQVGAIDTASKPGASAASAPADPPQASPADSGAPTEEKSATQRTSPAVRRIATEENIDPQGVVASGRNDRVTKLDMLNAQAAKQERPQPAPTPPSAPASSAPAQKSAAPPPRVEQQEAESASEAQYTMPMPRIRKKIAANLVASKRDAAHLTTFNEIDMTEVMQLRAQYKEEFEKVHGIRIGFMSFFVTAASSGLMQYPDVHAFLNGDTVTYNRNTHIGVALAAAQGLIVPVIKYAQNKSFADIEKEIKNFAMQAKERRLLPDALMGGTFTITNGGVFGSLLSTPIPNPPQTAILGMHTIKERAAVVNGAVCARPMMYVALTYDHRLIDGKQAVGFLKHIKEGIEQPARLMLNL